MSEAFEELEGDAEDAFEDLVEVMDDKSEKTSRKSDDGNKSCSPNKSKTSSLTQKVKPPNKNISSTNSKSVKSVGNDLLQALCGGTIFTPSIQMKTKEVTIKQQSKKPQAELMSSQVKPGKPDPGIKNMSGDLKMNEKGKDQTSEDEYGSAKDNSSDRPETTLRNENNSEFADECLKDEEKVTENIISDKVKSESLKTEDEKEKKSVLPRKDQTIEAGSGFTKDRMISNLQPVTTNKEKQEKVIDKEKFESKNKENEKEKKPILPSVRKRPSGQDVECSPSERKYSKTTSDSTTRDNQSDTKNVEESSTFSEDDFKNIDQQLVEQMMDEVIGRTLPTRKSTDARYRMKVSPLEIADLASESVQTLIQTHPKISFIFKRQTGKFKKKKGYAEINFTKMMEVKEFLKAFIIVKLIEKKIDVSVTTWLAGTPTPKTLSFQFCSGNSHKLVNLIKSGQDPLARTLDNKAESLQFDTVPSDVTAPMMQVIFPFCAFVRISKEVKSNHSGKSLNGPMYVHYNSFKWLEAVMDCCSNFTVDGYCLTWQDQNKDQSLNRERNKNDQEQSLKDNQKEKSTAGVSSIKSRDDKGISPLSETTDIEEKEEFEDDDAISNMTRDVCAGMLESLDKLKQLDANNPNIERILKMRDQLDKLQKSLIAPKETKRNVDIVETNPWKINYDDSIDKSKDSDSSTKCFSDNDSRQRNLRKVSGPDVERQNNKKDRNEEQVTDDPNEMKQKDKGMTAYQRGNKNPPMRKTDISKQKDDKRQKFEGEKLKKEEELQRQEEEARKEAERKKLIQKIEEARQRDLQKAKERALSETVFDSNLERKKESPISRRTYGDKELRSSLSGNKEHSHERHSHERENSRSGKRSFGESQSEQDDGLDQRLAAFEQELAEKGVIQPHPSSLKRPRDRDSDSILHCDSAVPILREDEYERIVAEGRHHLLPPDFHVRIQSSLNRHCPVKTCPDTKFFRDVNSFMEHWSIFHVPESTMRFCQKCVAYFVNPEELEMHLEKRHRVSTSEAKFMVHQARVKVIHNPSYRDPKPYLPPLL